MDCLDNIIGLSQTTCECLTENESDSEISNESASGVWLDELDGFNINVAKSADNCAKGGLWERMSKSVELAKQDFITNLLGCVNQRFQMRAEIFSGQLGSEDFKNTQSLSNDFVGLMIKPFQLKGGYIKLKRIGIVINNSVAVTVKVYRSVNRVGTLINSYTTDAPVTGNQLTWLTLTEALELPMWSYGGTVEYYIVLEMNGTFQPKDNVRDCGCGGVQRPYLQWLNFHGTKGNNPASFSSFTQTKSLNGIVIDVDVRCKASEIICSSEHPLDFSDDAKSRDMAFAIRYRAAAKLYADIISSEKIDRFTMLNREHMDMMITAWNAEYSNWIKWFCENVNVGVNDCLICRDGKKMYKGIIMT